MSHMVTLGKHEPVSRGRQTQAREKHETLEGASILAWRMRVLIS